MAAPTRAPQASLLRLSRYHCFVGEFLHSEAVGRLTSSRIAEELGMSEEAVRRDLSYIDVAGRPGSGYDAEELYAALGGYLDLSAQHPFIAIGNRHILEGLTITFPAEEFCMRPVGYFSDRPEDVGQDIDGITVRALDELPQLAPELGARICLVACAPGAVDRSLDLIAEAGITGVLMLTPVLTTRHPAGLSVDYFRIPCNLKSLAGRSADDADSLSLPSCCAAKQAR